MATEANVVPWHPLDNPECGNCHGLSRPIRPKRNANPFTGRYSQELVVCNPGLIQIGVDPRTLERRRIIAYLRYLIQAARIPQGDFARYIGVTPPTLSGYLNGNRVPQSKKNLIYSMRAVESNVDEFHVVHRKSTYGPRWGATLDRREARLANPLAAALQESADATSRRLIARLRSPATPQNYSRQSSTPG